MLTCSNQGTTTPWGYFGTISSLTTPIFSKRLQPLHQADWGCGSKNLLCLDICNMLYMKRHYSNFSLCTNHHAHLFQSGYDYPLRLFWNHLIPQHSHIFKKVAAIAKNLLCLENNVIYATITFNVTAKNSIKSRKNTSSYLLILLYAYHCCINQVALSGGSKIMLSFELSRMEWNCVTKFQHSRSEKMI